MTLPGSTGLTRTDPVPVSDPTPIGQPGTARRPAQEPDAGARSEIELTLQVSVAELRAREEALAKSEEQLRLVTDALPMLVSFVDTGQRYRFVSAAYERWFGRPKESLVGRTIEEVLGAPAYDVVRPHVEKALRGSRVTFATEIPYREGGSRFVEGTYIPNRTAKGELTGFVAFITDVTERRSLEQYREAASSRAERLLRVTASLADAVTSEQVFVSLVDRVADAVEASSAGLWLVDTSDNVARLVRSQGYSDSVARQLTTLPLDLEPSLPVLDSIRRGEPIWIPNRVALLESYPHLAKVVTPDRRYRVACLPLISQGRVLGSLGLTIESEGPSSVDERGFLLLLSRYASQALERLRLLDAELAARSRAEQLYEFAQAVSAAGRVDDVYDAALISIETALGTPRLSILTYDDAGVMRFRAWRQLSDRYRNAVEGHSPWSRDATQFDPVLVEDVTAEPSLAAFTDLFREEGIGALAFFPLVTGGHLLGKFMVYFDRPHRFLPHELEMAGAIAGHLASVITRFNAISQLEETVRANELFAAVLAHDLRNPLGAIMTSAQVMLMRQEGSATVAGYSDSQPLSRILRSGQRMTTMIDQLLDFTRARSGGGIHVEPHNANLADLCSQAIGELELAHPDWRIRSEVQGNAGGVWDGARLLQVISNLVGNAGQHGTPGGEIVVTVDGRDHDVVRLEVRNDGVIPETLRTQLFNPFLGSRRAQNQVGGLGLGLFIVRELVRAHGGTVNAVCEEMQTFVEVSLPRTTTRTRAPSSA